MLTSNSLDRPLGVQILGCEPDFILRALEVLSNYKFDLLDFNAACPVKKVIRRGEGASLLKDPRKLRKILTLLVKNSHLPVTVKIRTGWDKNSVNAQEIAKLAQDCGVSGIFIHGRTKSQEYAPGVDYQTIRGVKKNTHIAIIASGDIFSGPLAKKMLDETGCDGLAVARGAFGNPWIFKEIIEFLKSGKLLERPPRREIAKAMTEHLGMCTDFYTDRIGVIKFRKFFHWYTKGARKSRLLREKASGAKNKEEMLGVIKHFAFSCN
jgi:tRNA-dihydrouridine synthase B